MGNRDHVLELIKAPEGYLCEHSTKLIIAMLNGLETEEVVEWFRCANSVLSGRVNGWDDPLSAIQSLLSDYTVEHDQFIAGCLDVAKAQVEAIENYPGDRK